MDLRLLLRDRAALGAARSSPDWPASTAIPSASWPTTRCQLRRRPHRRRLRQADPLRRPLRHLPSARSCTSWTSPASSSASPPRSASTIRQGVRALAAVYQASTMPWVLDHRPPRLRRGRRRPWQRAGAEPPLRMALGRLGLAAARGRHRGGLQAGAGGGARPPGAAATDRGAAERRALPFRTAEVFNIEEIIDPRDTRPLLTDWVSLAYELEATRLGPKTRGARP